MTHPPKDVELYLHKALPTGDSVTRGPLRAAVTIDQSGQVELAIAAAPAGEQATALASMLTDLLLGMAECFGGNPSDLAVLAAYEALTRRCGTEDSGDE